jgi:hypothetical protein
MLLRARVLVYFHRQVARKKGAFAAFGSSHPGPHALPVEAQEPHVAGITSVRPNKKDAEKNALDKSSSDKNAVLESCHIAGTDSFFWRTRVASAFTLNSLSLTR